MRTRAASYGDGANKPVPLESARHELHQILESPAFADASRLRALLSFLVEETICGRAAQLKESIVAVEVFGRRADFDHRTDSVVRVQIHNLRNKLRTYYAGEGKEHSVRIELPAGSYIPAFQAWQPVQPQENAPDIAHGSRVLRKYAAAAVVLVLCGVGWSFRLEIASHWAGAPRSIAVLPFLDLSGGGDSEHFTDGVVDDLTTALAKVPAMRVVARTSAFQFRGRNEDARKIGQQLGVKALLEGSVRREGSRVRLTAQLINAENGYHLWSNSYDRDVTGVQEMEGDIVRSAADAMGARLPHPAGSPHAPPPEARDAYWRGRYVSRSWQRVSDCVRYFDQAVAIDPQFADAWAALSATHATLAFNSEGSVPEEAGKAKGAAGRALQLDEGNPEAHTALALVSYSYDRDWQAAERSFRRALESNPSYVWAHRVYALALTFHGRFDDALAQIRLAQELDPASILSNNTLVAVLYDARRYNEAISIARRHLEMDPQYFPAHSIIGLSLAAQGKLAEAIPELDTAATQGKQYPELSGSLGNALARAGRVAEARTLLARIQAGYHAEGAVAVSLSLVYTGLGEKREAIECLRRAARVYATGVNTIGVEPIFDPLRGEPEFQALCARLRLPH